MEGAVRYVHDAVVAAMNGGQDVWTAMREIRLPPELEQGEGYGTVAWSVRAIWEMYAGWFHHHSTTELYAVPAGRVHAELVALAGGAGRHRRRGAGEGARRRRSRRCTSPRSRSPPRRAIAARSTRASRRTARCSPRSVNFWEVRWLEQQIRTARAAALARGAVSTPRHPHRRPRPQPRLDRRGSAPRIAYAAARVPVVRQRRTRCSRRRSARPASSDFGADDFRPACASGCRRSNDDVELGPLGRLGLYGNCVRFLANRLRLEDLLRRHPEILDIADRAGRSSSPGCRAPARRTCSTCSPPTRGCARCRTGRRWSRCRRAARAPGATAAIRATCAACRCTARCAPGCRCWRRCTTCRPSTSTRRSSCSTSTSPPISSNGCAWRRAGATTTCRSICARTTPI